MQICSSRFWLKKSAVKTKNYCSFLETQCELLEMQEWRNVGLILKRSWLLAESESWSVNVSTSFANGKTSQRQGVRVMTHHGCAFPFLLTVRLVSPSDLCVPWQEPQSLTWHWPAAPHFLGAASWMPWTVLFILLPLKSSLPLLQHTAAARGTSIPPTVVKNGCWELSMSLFVIAQEASTSSCSCIRNKQNT